MNLRVENTFQFKELHDDGVEWDITFTVEGEYLKIDLNSIKTVNHNTFLKI